MIDIDHFKRYNDHYGHLQGDDCLRRVAQALAMTATRAGDLVSRYGGEEFAVLLPGSSLEAAAALGAKVCAAIRALAIPHADSDAESRVTVSIGAASGIPSRRLPGPGSQTTEPSAVDGASGLASVAALLARADRALYAAKAAGRDRVCMDDPGSEAEPSAPA